MLASPYNRTRRRIAPAILLAALVLGSLAVSPALAQEEAHGEPTQIERIWNAAWAVGLFVILVAVLTKFGWKPVMRALQDRESAVTATVAQAEQRKEEAAKLLAEYQARIEAAHEEAAQVVEKAMADAAAVRERMLAEAREAAGRTAQDAQRQIEQAKRDALAEIYQSAAELATDMAGRLLQKEIAPADQQRLITEGLAQFREPQD